MTSAKKLKAIYLAKNLDELQNYADTKNQQFNDTTICKNILTPLMKLLQS